MKNKKAWAKRFVSILSVTALIVLSTGTAFASEVSLEANVVEAMEVSEESEINPAVDETVEMEQPEADV